MQINNHIHNSYEAKVYSRGIIKIPSSIRDDLQVHDGDKILFLRKNDTWILTTHKKNITEIQNLISSSKLKDSSIMEGLIQDRKNEAEQEFKV
jgi:AbrB family looped-hinge helix DNA binding protein